MPCTRPLASTAAAFDEVAARFGETDDRGGRPGARGQLLERLGRFGDERGPKQEILRRVAGDRELREHDEVGADRGRGLVRVEDTDGVAREIADDRVQLRGRDSNFGHELSLLADITAESAGECDQNERATLGACERR